jgi:hypothetical protein
VERLRTAVHKRLHDVARRERLVEKRERELNLLRERVASHAAAKHFVAGSAATNAFYKTDGTLYRTGCSTSVLARFE